MLQPDFVTCCARWREQLDNLTGRIARGGAVAPSLGVRVRLLSGLRRKNGWTIAELAYEPHRVQ